MLVCNPPQRPKALWADLERAAQRPFFVAGRRRAGSRQAGARAARRPRARSSRSRRSCAPTRQRWQPSSTVRRTCSASASCSTIRCGSGSRRPARAGPRVGADGPFERPFALVGQVETLDFPGATPAPPSAVADRCGRRAHRWRLVSGLRTPLRQGRAATVRPLLAAHDPHRRRRQARHPAAVRLVREMVALHLAARRAGAGTLGGLRKRRPVDRVRDLLAGRRQAPPARRGGPRSAAHADGARGRPRGRALADRATATGRARARRQGGPRGRCRRRRRPRTARDADDAARGLHADRPRRRRSAQAPHAAARREGARHDGRPAAPAARAQARRGAHRDSLGCRRSAQPHRRRLPYGTRARPHAAGGARARGRRLEPAAPAARGAGGGRARTRPRAARPGRDRGLRPRPRRARDRRGRLDRLRALPPARAHEPDAPRAAGPRRDEPLPDRARAPRTRRHEHRARDRRCEGRGQARPAVPRLPARGRVPCRGVQARAADAGEPARGDPQQRDRDAHARPRRREARDHPGSC